MISFGMVAFDEQGETLGEFRRNVEPLADAVQDEDTMNWWKTQPEAYKKATCNPVPAYRAMEDAVAWVQSICAPRTRPCMICFPSAFDNTFWRYYAMIFTGDDPFRFNCIDGASFAMGKLGISRRDASLRSLYDRFLTEEEKAGHNHDALSDCRTQGLLFFRMRASK